MKKLLIIFLLCLPFFAAAEECANDQPVCFGINWETATISDIDGIDVNARNELGSTPLHEAAHKNDNPKIILTLLKAGANIKARDNYGWIPLHRAVRFNSNPQIIEILLKAGSNLNARNKYGHTTYDLLRENEKLKGTPVYWKLHDLSFD